MVRSGSDLGSGSSGSSCCCCWQHVRLPPRGVCRFLCWHVLKLEFWHFARPKLNLGFVFASVFAVFSSKKMPQPAGCTVQKHAQLSISHPFFRRFPACVTFRFRFCSVLAISRLSAHAGFDLHLSFNSVLGGLGRRGGDGGGGVMTTSMRLRLVFSFSFSFVDHLLLLGYVVVRCSGGGGGGG